MVIAVILNICISPRGQHLKSQTERLPRTLMLKIWKKWLPCNLQTYGRPTRAWRAPDGTKELYQFCPFCDVWVIWWFWVPTQENWRTMFLLKIGYSQLWKEGSFRDTERGGVKQRLISDSFVENNCFFPVQGWPVAKVQNIEDFKRDSFRSYNAGWYHVVLQTKWKDCWYFFRK